MIPVYQPTFNGNEKKYVNDCLDSTWISSKGEYIARFEKEFAKYIGCEYATVVANGTVAVHLAMLMLGIGAGDEVIVPTLTYIASANAIKYVGATPVFVDSLQDSWQMDPEDIRRKITQNTKAIIVVHLYGHPCDMGEIMQIAKERELFVVEDVAEAIGSEYKNKKTGCFGDIACFSFFGNKTITTGEGGMVLTSDRTLYDRALSLRNQGNALDREYWNDRIGYNFRATNICAAIGLAQLEQVEGFVKRKIEIAQLYKQCLCDLPLKTHEPIGDVLHTYWMFSVLVEKVDDRDELRNYLRQNDIETRPTFYPIHTMPMYAEKYQRFPIAEYIGWRGINLPSWPGLSDENIVYIGKTIKNYFMNK